MEVDLHGGGFDARGALFPGCRFVVIGRGPTTRGARTSSQADNIDVFVETLCGDDDALPLQGHVPGDDTFDAGDAAARPARPTSR